MARGDIRRQSSASRRSALTYQFPPQKYPITSVCRPATGSMPALGSETELSALFGHVRFAPMSGPRRA
jgi:hypothetical protein